MDVLKQNSTPSPANVFNLISLNLVQHCLSELGLPTCNEEESVVEIKESACFLFCEDYDSFNKFFSRYALLLFSVLFSMQWSSNLILLLVPCLVLHA